VSADTDWDQVADWLERQAERTIETSCARVFLRSDVAWKMKRPVRFAFLDFSTRDRRQWALDRELAFNRRWAIDIYRAVRAVTRDGEFFALDGQGEVVEWLLEMRRFDPDAVLANRPQTVDGKLAETLGRVIARAHIEAPAAPDGGGAAALGYTIATNETSLRRAPKLDAAAVRRLIDRTRISRDALGPLLDSRRRAGFGRQCHGDLHLGNILLEVGRPIPFDCIEFNDQLSRIDVLYDAAFPIMDLVVRGRDGAANRLLNAYLDEAARGMPSSQWRGLAALPLFLSVRAAVRAHVTAATGEDDLAKQYLVAAEGFLEPPTARLFAVGGLSGTGKSTFARALAPLVPDAPGAVTLRSDEIRKRLMGVGHLDPLPETAYEPDQDARVYDEVLKLGAAVFRAGRSVILDATFLAPRERLRVERLAASLGAPMTPVWMEGNPALLRARLAARTADSSDATLAVLDRQLASDPGTVTWPRISADAEFGAVVRRLAARPGG
jgi:aminoglycoside phosphotransferase family enzyme/predicted kinase